MDQKLDEGIKGKEREGFESRTRQESRSLKLALTGLLAGIYAITTFALGVISYEVLNLRLSNILIGIVPILGWPSVLGITLGVLLANLGSPLGPIDLISPVFSLAGLTILYLVRRKSVLLGLISYSLILSIWVTTELDIVGLVRNSTFLLSFVTVLAGISFVVVVLGYLLYKALEAIGLGKMVEAKIGRT